LSTLAEIGNVFRAAYGDATVKTASIGGSGTWALDRDPSRRGFPEELDCAGERTVLGSFYDVETPFGPVPSAKALDVDGFPVIRVPVHGWRFPVPTTENTLAVFWLLSHLGVEQVVVDASVGGVKAEPWDVVIPEDVMVHDEAKLAVTRLAVELGRTPWVRMAQPFCPGIRRALATSFRRLTEEGDEKLSGVFRRLIDGGLYYTTPLSVFETAAEVRFIESLGATVVGQSMGQEAAAARVCGMCLAVINPVANYAEGLGGGVWIEGGMEAFYSRIALPMAQVVYWALQDVVANGTGCNCKVAIGGTNISTFTEEKTTSNGE